jgi:hypothetical protein
LLLFPASARQIHGQQIRERHAERAAPRSKFAAPDTTPDRLGVVAREHGGFSDAHEPARCLAGFREKLLGWKEQLLPKHPMAEAISYILGQWEELNVFRSDGAVPIDNNVSEREMKRVVLNRKNSLFVGNARGGRRRRFWRA